MRSDGKYSKVAICRHMKKAIGDLVCISKRRIRVENGNCQKVRKGIFFNKLKSFKKNWEIFCVKPSVSNESIRSALKKKK